MVNSARRQDGFTIIELMIVVVIVAVLAALAAPSMALLISTQAVKSASYDILSDFTFARNEAISRYTNVTVRGASSTDWKQGWIITEAAGGTTLRSQSARSGSFTLTGTVNSVTFDVRGRPTSGATVSFDILPTIANAQTYMQRCVLLDPSGRVRSTIGACT